MISRSRLLEIHHAIALLLPKDEANALLNCLLAGHTALYMDDEIAARSAAVAADPTARAKYDPVPNSLE